ncbi:MAG: hypothetical protein JWP91_1179 [Fibrobacteres bacterium]|nr:hypothetical protein [Fibrobacterota bacterium]
MAIAAEKNSLYAYALMAIMACSFTVRAAPQRVLDQSRIHANYHDGEFDKVIKELEGFLKSGRSCSHAESLFLEKHLAVVYAANPGTRELGRYHMFRLLDLAPGSDLLDMFVGEEVDGVFQKVGKEYALRNASQARAAASPSKPFRPAVSAPAPATVPPAARPAILSPAPAPSRPAFRAASFTAPAPILSAATHAYRPAVRSPVKSPAPVAASKSPVPTPSLPDAAETTVPAWKEPGLWIGGGAALAVVAFTLFYSGPEAAPAGKTYVVPASASTH